MINSLTVAVGQDINIENMVNRAKGDYAYTLLDINDGDEAAIIERAKAIEGVIRVRII